MNSIGWKECSRVATRTNSRTKREDAWIEAFRTSHKKSGGIFDPFIDLDGEDLRRDPLAVRKARLASVLARAAPGLRFTEHLDEEDGPLVFAHACKLGLEGIVSKRRESFYSSGRSPHWIKTKNPDAPAVKREADEDWGGWSARTRHSRR